MFGPSEGALSGSSCVSINNAPSDGPNMVPLSELKDLLKQLTEIDKLVK